MNMKVILNEAVEHLGERGKICEVKVGYARNFLIPKGLAYEATPAMMARFRQEQRRWLTQQAKEKGSAEAMAQRLAGLELTFSRRAGEGDTLYGSVTAADVADAIQQRGFDVDRRKILLPQHIKRTGTYAAELHLHREVRVPITLHVNALGAEGTPTA